MSNTDQVSADLFFKLRNRFPKIHMGDDQGSATVDPEKARFFNFVYVDKVHDRSYGNVTCSIVDDNALKIFFDTSITDRMLPEDKAYWYDFLKELRTLAKGHMLNFDVRDITKDTLSKQDLQFMTQQQNKKKDRIKTESIMEGRVLWNRRGKVSEGDLNNVRIHVVHSEKMLENNNNRLLKVDRIFCVNENGEKFLLPFKSVSGAKAMANHISRGGNPYDTNGQVISRAVSEMRNLGRFTSATRTKTFESEQANQVITAAQQMKESIRGHLMRLTNNSRSFTESLEALSQLLPESEQDITELKGWFTTQAYNENLDNYLGSAAGAYNKLRENAHMAITETNADVKKKILDPNFRLVLKKDPAMDKLMSTRKYTDSKALLSAILGDIANRCIDPACDDVANFASLMGDLVSSEGEAFGTRPDESYNHDKKLALMLAHKYMKDLKQVESDPAQAEQLRRDPQARAKMSDRKGKTPGDEFEEAVMGMGEDDPVHEATSNAGDSEQGAMGSDDEDWRDITGKKDPEGAYKGKKGKYHPERDDTKGKPEPWNESTEINNTSKETAMSKKQIEEMRKLAGLPLLENYIYATEEDDEHEENETEHEEHEEHETGHEEHEEHEEHDGEYSDEAGMAKDQLTSAERAATELKDLLGSDEDLPEWVQAKITKAVDYLSMANNTMKSRHEQGDVHKMAEAKKAKPDFLDMDKDGDKKESMKKAVNDKEEKMDEAKGKKPDFLDMDKDGDKEEPMSKALKDKEDKKVSENIAWMQAVAGIRTK